jgi:nitrite reductase/ring-hydroxylating ferredoxin subunit
VAEWVKVAKTNDIAPGEAKAVDVGARRIALFNIEGAYHAIDDTCTHRGGPGGQPGAWAVSAHLIFK